MDNSHIRPTTLKKSNKVVILLSMMLALAVVIATILAFLWLNRAGEVAKLTKAQTESSNKIKQLQQEVSATGSDDVSRANDTPAAVSPSQPSSADEDKSISAVVIAYAHASKGSETATFTIQSIKKDSNFARVGVSTEDGPGYFCVTKKVDALWLVLYCGQADPEQSELDRWGVPPSLLSN